MGTAEGAGPEPLSHTQWKLEHMPQSHIHLSAVLLPPLTTELGGGNTWESADSRQLHSNFGEFNLDWWVVTDISVSQSRWAWNACDCSPALTETCRSQSGHGSCPTHLISLGVSPPPPPPPPSISAGPPPRPYSVTCQSTYFVNTWSVPSVFALQ